LDIARIEAAADVQAVRADALTYVGKRAMRDVALLTQLEQQLALIVRWPPSVQASATSRPGLAEVVSGHPPAGALNHDHPAAARRHGLLVRDLHHHKLCHERTVHSSGRRVHRAPNHR